MKALPALVALVFVVVFAWLAVNAVGSAIDQRIAELDCAMSQTCEPTP